MINNLLGLLRHPVLDGDLGALPRDVLDGGVEQMSVYGSHHLNIVLEEAVVVAIRHVSVLLLRTRGVAISNRHGVLS